MAETERKQGKFYCVSVGPGDPELLTIKALRVLRGCEIIACPQTQSGRRLAWEIASGALERDEKQCLPLSFHMQEDPALRERLYRDAGARIEAHLAAGRDVAMIALGDVSLYATASPLLRMLGERGYETEMIPGVSSFCAAAARLGISLAEGKDPLHVLPGQGDADEALQLGGTKVFLKSGRGLSELLRKIEARGLRAMAVRNCGLPGEAVYEDLSREPLPEEPGYFVTVIVKE